MNHRGRIYKIWACLADPEQWHIGKANAFPKWPACSNLYIHAEKPLCLGRLFCMPFVQKSNHRTPTFTFAIPLFRSSACVC
eukprot:scaffold604338_cov19-Prasinocladus_malaysianus.AAC.2